MQNQNQAGSSGSFLGMGPMLGSTNGAGSSGSTASSSQIPLLNTENDLDRLRGQTLTKLTTVLFRNLRVRYEVDVEGLVSGYVSQFYSA